MRCDIPLKVKWDWVMHAPCVNSHGLESRSFMFSRIALQPLERHSHNFIRTLIVSTVLTRQCFSWRAYHRPSYFSRLYNAAIRSDECFIASHNCRLSATASKYVVFSPICPVVLSGTRYNLARRLCGSTLRELATKTARRDRIY